MSQAVFPLGRGGAGADADAAMASVGSESVEEGLPASLPPCRLHQGPKCASLVDLAYCVSSVMGIWGKC